ncbi:ATP-binding protein [Streptomyces sp. NPDC059209]|uniref:ATP-binding protein n=1 Tax=Streptomyces sp. NPDC059209 TaxID=3346769 RepID=UPI0036AAD674
MSCQCAEDRLVLVAVPEAVRRARDFAVARLRSWEAACVMDDALLVASELVTNAVRATGLVAVQLRIAGPSLYVEVWDGVPGVPEVKPLEVDAEGGRGLRLVEALTTRWGVYRPRSGGKVVWAELPLPAPAPLLSPEAAAEELADAVLLERVLDALRGW